MTALERGKGPAGYCCHGRFGFVSYEVKELRKQRYPRTLPPKALLGGRVAFHHGRAGYCSHCNPLHVWNERKKIANINHEAVISTLLKSSDIALILDSLN